MWKMEKARFDGRALTFFDGTLLSCVRCEETSMRRFFLFFPVLFIALANVQGQAQKPAGKTYVLKAARMFDGKGSALSKPGLVVVSEGKIVAAGANAAVPARAEIIDLGDATLLPGFIDAHTHLTS